MDVGGERAGDPGEVDRAERGVVERGLALREAVAVASRPSLDDELARLFDHAALAASRLDQLEATLSAADLRSGDEVQRARWLARDRWAARLLEVTAFLDAMRARVLAAQARAVGGAELDEVRAQVAALAEVEAL